jgi:hypothetical protein
MTEQYARLDQKAYESHYVYIDAILNFPVERVWPHALQIGKWMTDHRMETIAGQPGRIGHFERVFAKGVSSEVPLPHHHYYGIAEIIPMRCIALEVFPEKGGSYGNTRERMAFDCILLIDLGGRTKVIFLQIDVDLGVGKSEKGKGNTLEERIQRYFRNLEHLVASER